MFFNGDNMYLFFHSLFSITFLFLLEACKIIGKLALYQLHDFFLVVTLFYTLLPYAYVFSLNVQYTKIKIRDVSYCSFLMQKVTWFEKPVSFFFIKIKHIYLIGWLSRFLIRWLQVVSEQIKWKFLKSILKYVF